MKHRDRLAEIAQGEAPGYRHAPRAAGFDLGARAAMSSPTGSVVMSTPFLLKVHEGPLDLYGWTEHRMRQLLETANFTVMTAASWGSLECLASDMQPGLGWTIYDDPIKHSLQNEPQFPIVVWAFAKKGILR